MKRLVPVAMLLALAASSAGATVTLSENFSRSFPLPAGGTVSIQNQFGSVVVIGTGDENVTVSAVKTSVGVDEVAARIGLSKAALVVRPLPNTLAISAVRPAEAATVPWRVSVAWTVRVPRSASVEINVGRADLVRVENLDGNALVRSSYGRIEISNVRGPLTVDGGNSDIVATFGTAFRAPATITTVNGGITVGLLASSRFNWIAETLRGDIFTAFPQKGSFDSSEVPLIYRDSINGGGPLLRTSAAFGRVIIGRHGEKVLATLVKPDSSGIRQASAARPLDNTLAPLFRRVSRMLMQPPSASTFTLQQARFDGNMKLESSMGNIFIAEVTGDALVRTSAGEVVLGSIGGRCEVISDGGPVNLGEIRGPLFASTAAGDVTVRLAGSGGRIATRGGNIRIGHSAGPLALTSAGGDITVERSDHRVDAETRSGDISIVLSGRNPLSTVSAKTAGGNIAVRIPPNVGVDVDATIHMSEGRRDRIESEFNGLKIVREQVNGKTTIRATGRINGGGEKMLLVVEDGSIQLRNAR
jgi:DUF4097 and DUF4098 domain-containing protein YvlB